MAEEALSLPRVPIGDGVDAAVDFLRTELSGFFNAVQTVFGASVDAMEWLITLPPPLLFAAIAGLIGWRVRSWQFGAFAVVAFGVVDSMNLWDETMATLALILIATVLAVIISLPVGILAARSDAVSTVVRPILDFMQTLPVLVYLIPAVLLLGIGTPGGLAATLIFALPPGVRLTELGIRTVDSEVVEAAEAFGSSRNRTLLRVQMPLALPAIMQGINQIIMLALSMVVVAGFIGAGGLGNEVVRSISRVEVGTGFEAGLAVVILAIFLDRLTSAVGQPTRKKSKQAA